ncbi:uncharacterized protein JCM15063_002709 [Sporobolomyces koalae]|uniref:uncharacterized protein n=1 Tax=Sporobolomyces koalae TaxID=500713 RepID=UPI00316EFFB9
MTDAKGKAKEQGLEDFDDLEFDKILNAEASLLSRESEVMRVLACFKLNPYEILELNWLPDSGVTDQDIQRAYRKKSLLIHPDKLKHPRGIEAFDLLKKAQTELADPTKRGPLDDTLRDARMLVLREIGLKADVPNDHEKIKSSFGKEPGDSLKERVKKKAKEIMIDDELRRRRVQKMTMIAEGAEAKRAEDALAERKRKAEEKERWEDSREDRVTDWRSFSKGPKKKKGKKNQVLG